jgi:uncharacterized LabA/DUF88 family protein
MAFALCAVWWGLVTVRTAVYIDAFNLYYGALRSTGYKWLDLRAFCQRVLDPQHNIIGIRYFTALVKPRVNDPQQDVRQQTYIRAIRTIPELSVHYGSYITKRAWMPKAKSGTRAPDPEFDQNGRVRQVEVIKTEEKGSDVNIGFQLVADAFKGQYECGVVISNDSDLVGPIDYVRNDLGIDVGVINPHPRSRRSQELRRVAKFQLHITEMQHLRPSQFPPSLTDPATGQTITKPASW